MPRKSKSRAPGALERVGEIFRDEQGQYVFSPSLKQGGAPRKRLRDVSLTLHYEFLTGLDRFKKTEAKAEVAKMFLLKDLDRHAAKIIKRTCTEILVDYPECVVVTALDLDGKPTRILMALVQGSTKDLTALGQIEGDGFTVKWGDRTAAYGNVKVASKGWKPAP